MDKTKTKKEGKVGRKGAEKPAYSGCIAIVRERGRSTTFIRAERSMLLLNLSRVNHCVVLPDNGAVRGMINRAKDYLAWGKPSEGVVEELFSKAGRTAEGKPLTDAYVKERAGYASVKALAGSVYKAEINIGKVKAVKPVFRLAPPRGGPGRLKGVFPRGALGARGTQDIDRLIKSML